MLEVSTKGTRFGVAEHFSQSEWIAEWSIGSWFNVRHFCKYPLLTFSNPSLFTAIKPPYGSIYAARLAFFQRIKLPLEYTLRFRNRTSYFPIEEAENFRQLQHLFTSQYESLFKMDGHNERKRGAVKERILHLGLRFWCAGYAIFPDYGIEPLTSEVLEGASKILNQGRIGDRHRVIWFLHVFARLLAQDARSKIDRMPNIARHAPASYFDLEKAAWSSMMASQPASIISENLHEFVFTELISRVTSHQVRTVRNLRGRTFVTRRGGLGRLSASTWRNYARYLRALGMWASQSDYDIERMFDKGLSDYMRQRLGETSRSDRNAFRAAAREWVRWYSDTRDLALNPYKVVPRELRSRGLRYAAILDIGSACIFINTLLDNDTGLINENNLLEFRCRRACLIALETGARMSSVCVLPQDCIVRDHLGNHLIHFHRVKTGKPYSVPASPSLRAWVTELKRMGPPEKMYIATDKHYTGDGLTQLRLFANAMNDGPLTISNLSKFLRLVQKKIWPNEHPNGQPFSTRSLRRLRALYMVLLEKRREEIQQQLGHSSIDSQIPYVATGPPQVQRWFGEMLKEGIWKNVSKTQGAETDLDLDKVLKQEVGLADPTTMMSIVRRLVEESPLAQSSYEVDRRIPIQLNQVAAGFPRRTHNCTAHELLNCGHTELHCFNCDKYKPDLEMFDDHRAEVFRYMVLVCRAEKSKGKQVNTFDQRAIELKTETVSDLIRKAMPLLFGRHYNMDPESISALQEELINKAQAYVAVHGYTAPSPTFEEARVYLKQETRESESLHSSKIKVRSSSSETTSA